MQFAPRVGAIWQPTSTTSVRAHGACSTTPRICSTTSAIRASARASTIPNPAGGFDDPYLGYPGGNPYPRVLELTWRSTFNQFSGYATYPLHTDPTRDASVEPERFSARSEAGVGCELSRQPHRPTSGVARPSTRLSTFRASPRTGNVNNGASCFCRTRRRPPHRRARDARPTPGRPTTRACCCRRSAGCGRTSACCPTGRFEMRIRSDRYAVQFGDDGRRSRCTRSTTAVPACPTAATW